MENTIEMSDYNQPEGAEGGDEAVIDDTPINEDDFQDGLTDNDRLDDAKISSFREENKDDSYRRRKKQLHELSTYGKFDDIKGEYVRRLLRSNYHINPDDGPSSKNFISLLDITKNKLKFSGVEIAYIGTDGMYRFSNNKRNSRYVAAFSRLYDKALEEHKQKARSVIEEETDGESPEETTENILEDVMEELHQETATASETLAEEAERLEIEGIITTQERREFAGVTAPKGPPEVRIKSLKAQRVAFETNIELETDPDRQHIRQRAVDVTERGIDDARLEMGQHPESEEGKHRFREIVREDIRTKFERFRKWAKENLGALTAIAISIAGIITTVVVAGKKTIVGASKGLGAVGKALAGLAKSALPILVPILNLLSTILSWGAKGPAFLAQNLWIVAILIAGAIYKYLQNKRKK
jgi:hypothetical protein